MWRSATLLQGVLYVVLSSGKEQTSYTAIGSGASSGNDASILVQTNHVRTQPDDDDDDDAVRQSASPANQHYTNVSNISMHNATLAATAAIKSLPGNATARNRTALVEEDGNARWVDLDQLASKLNAERMELEAEVKVPLKPVEKQHAAMPHNGASKSHKPAAAHHAVPKPNMEKTAKPPVQLSQTNLQVMEAVRAKKQEQASLTRERNRAASQTVAQMRAKYKAHHDEFRSKHKTEEEQKRLIQRLQKDEAVKAKHDTAVRLAKQKQKRASDTAARAKLLQEQRSIELRRKAENAAKEKAEIKARNDKVKADLDAAHQQQLTREVERIRADWERHANSAEGEDEEIDN